MHSATSNAGHFIRLCSFTQLYTFMYVYLLLPCILSRTLESI